MTWSAGGSTDLRFIPWQGHSHLSAFLWVFLGGIEGAEQPLACPGAVVAQGGGLSRDNIYQVSSRESRLVSADGVTSSGGRMDPTGLEAQPHSIRGSY